MPLVVQPVRMKLEHGSAMQCHVVSVSGTTGTGTDTGSPSTAEQGTAAASGCRATKHGHLEVYNMVIVSLPLA